MSNLFSALSLGRFRHVHFVIAPQRLGVNLWTCLLSMGLASFTRLGLAGLQDVVAQQEPSPGTREAFLPAGDRRHRFRVMVADDSGSARHVDVRYRSVERDLLSTSRRMVPSSVQ